MHNARMASCSPHFFDFRFSANEAPSTCVPPCTAQQRVMPHWEPLNFPWTAVASLSGLRRSEYEWSISLAPMFPRIKFCALQGTRRYFSWNNKQRWAENESWILVGHTYHARMLYALDQAMACPDLHSEYLSIGFQVTKPTWTNYCRHVRGLSFIIGPCDYYSK